ncbi:MAG TPA: hypothetical protein VGI40_21895 [Pirellulaceae bacterium]|jgi:hypothetical protein
MIPTPTDEISAIKQELAAQFGNDVHRIAEDIRQQQRESGRLYVTLPKRTPQPASRSGKKADQ